MEDRTFAERIVKVERRGDSAIVARYTKWDQAGRVITAEYLLPTGAWQEVDTDYEIFHPLNEDLLLPLVNAEGATYRFVEL